MKAKNIEAAKAVFAKNPEIKSLFFTDDEQAFESIGNANVHQKEIGGKKEAVEEVKREEGKVVSEKPEKEKTVKPEKDKTAKSEKDKPDVFFNPEEKDK